MAAKKAPYSAKAKVWLLNYTMELEGNAAGVISSIFGSLPADMRMLVLNKLQERHRDISSKEAQKETAA
nr:hypothetical protein [Escherichia coli]